MDAVLIAGGGIGGLAAALACVQRGLDVRVYERAQGFSEFGAGIQLGPNATRVLKGWGLESALDAVVARPQRLQVVDGLTGAELATARLDHHADHYGSPYWTIHRGDLHQMLVNGLEGRPEVQLNLDATVTGAQPQGAQVHLQLAGQQGVAGRVLIAADGAWSVLRQQLQADGTPTPTGHLAYRALVRQADLPAALRTQQVTLWMAPKVHAVHYPVRAGEWLNIVVIVEGQVQGDLGHWDHSANAADLRRVLATTHPSLQQRVQAIASWRLWPLSVRRPVQGAHELARGPVAWLGDAAHPMVPYLAQGAAMAIEDAEVLAQQLGQARRPQGRAWVDDVAPVQALQAYADLRWARVAKVQARAWRNGQIFHMDGALRAARNLALRVGGEALLSQPWLYGYAV